MTKRTIPAGERLARRLVAELGKRPTKRPWATVAALPFDQATFAKALLAAAERGWVRVDPVAEKGEAYPHSVMLTGDGWIEAQRLAPARRPPGSRPRPGRRS